MPKPAFANARFSNHSIMEMHRRGIEKALVSEILADPDRVHALSLTRVVLHKILIAGNTKKALLYRVFIDIDRFPPVVVTVYRTSKIAKYEQSQ